MEPQPTSHSVHREAALVTNKPYFDISMAYRRALVAELNALVPKYIRFVKLHRAGSRAKSSERSEYINGCYDVCACCHGRRSTYEASHAIQKGLPYMYAARSSAHTRDSRNRA